MANRDVLATNGWLESHRQWSQEQWIQDGFKEFGLTVQLPPSTNDVVPLLRLLGRRSWNFLTHGPPKTNAAGAIPNYAQYNAFRWLRDSGFKPAKFLSERAQVTADTDITAGLLSYSQWYAAFPADNGVGLLKLAPHSQIELGAGEMLPLFAKTGPKVGITLTILATLTVGLWLMTRNRRRLVPK